MSKDPQRLPDHLEHILQSIDRIGKYTAGMDQALFLLNEMAQDAVIRNLEVLGEASRNIERDHPGFAAAHPETAVICLRDAQRAGTRLFQDRSGNCLEHRRARFAAFAKQGPACLVDLAGFVTPDHLSPHTYFSQTPHGPNPFRLPNRRRD